MLINFDDILWLKRADDLLEEIDNNAKHPVNDLKHPDHAQSLAAYRELFDLAQKVRERNEKLERDYPKNLGKWLNEPFIKLLS